MTLWKQFSTCLSKLPHWEVRILPCSLNTIAPLLSHSHPSQLMLFRYTLPANIQVFYLIQKQAAGSRDDSIVHHESCFDPTMPSASVLNPSRRSAVGFSC